MYDIYAQRNVKWAGHLNRFEDSWLLKQLGHEKYKDHVKQEYKNSNKNLVVGS